MSKFKINSLPKNAKDPFAKATFDQQLKDRLANKTFPDQDRTNLCGPAAFFYCLQIKHPAFYRMSATHLYETGSAQIARLIVKPSDNCRQPKDFFLSNGTPRISGLDWITLASLRSSSSILPYDTPNETVIDMTSAITTPLQLCSWFEQAGFAQVEKFFLLNPENLVKLNDYYKKGYCVVGLTCGALISGQPDVIIPKPTHWVVWSSTLNDKNGKPITKSIKDSDIVTQTVFSWGNNKNSIKSFNFRQFCNHHFQFLVFKS